MNERKAIEMALDLIESEFTTKGENKYLPDEVIEALRQALAQPSGSVEQEPKCNPHPKAPHGFNRNASHANDRYTCECESWDAYEAGRLDGIAQEQAMYEVQRLGQEIQPEQEPVCWMVYTLDGASVCVTDNPADFTPEHRALPLYTAPPQRTAAEGEDKRTWVGLTDEDLENVWRNSVTDMDALKAVEYKLKEKNT